jgi:hypothetical protein
MAPQGFFGAAAAAAGAAGLAVCAAEPPAGGEASRWVTLEDCLPTDLPPPIRLASASPPLKPKVAVNASAKIADQNFIMSPLLFFEAR